MRSTIVIAAPLAAALLWLAGCGAAPSVVEPSVTLEPTRAPPGASVTLRAQGLPPDTRFGIGAGPPASEYEIFAYATSDGAGELTTTFTLPSWATSGRRLIFAVTRPETSFDVLSAPFVVD